MDLRQALLAARVIDANCLIGTGWAAKRAENGLGVAHLRWMVEEMHNGMSEDKAMRWLGYIQGSLVVRGMSTLEAQNFISREASKK